MYTGILQYMSTPSSCMSINPELITPSYAEFMKQESQRIFEQLPTPESWPDGILDLVGYEAMMELYDQSEELTFSLCQRAAKDYPDEAWTRTWSSPSSHLRRLMSRNSGVIRLESVEVAALYTGGASGSQTRRVFIDSLLENYNAEEVMERLPPIVLSSEKYLRGDQWVYSTIDGNTRAMVAAEKGLPEVRAYIYYPATAPITKE